MKKWLNSYLPTSQSIKNSQELKNLKSTLKAPYFWSRNHQSIARGVAAGLAGSVLPGFQFLYALPFVIILRGNIPIAFLFTFVNNPLTFVPLNYFTYYVGSLFIGTSQGDYLVQSFHWDFSSFPAFWLNFRIWILQFGKAFLIGLPIVSLCFGLLGYLGTLSIWKLLSYRKKKNK